MSAKVRVLVVIKGLGLGGAERLLSDGAAFWDRTRFDLEFLYFLPHKNHFHSVLEKAGFLVHSVDARGALGIIRAFLALFHLL